MGIIKWREPPFPVLKYGFCPDEETWNRERARVMRQVTLDITSYPSTDGMTTNWRSSVGDVHCLVTVSNHLDDNPIRLISTLCHEAYHVVRRMTEAMRDEFPSEEFIAYSLAEVVGQLFADYSAARSPLARKRQKSLDYKKKGA